MEHTELISLLNKELDITIPQQRSYEEVQGLLSQHLNNLIKNDFEKLVTYLYRIDVNEQKLKYLLQQQPDEDAGSIIADLIIERQLQKIKTRRQFSQRGNNINDEEKW